MECPHAHQPIQLPIPHTEEMTREPQADEFLAPALRISVTAFLDKSFGRRFLPLETP